MNGINYVIDMENNSISMEMNLTGFEGTLDKETILGCIKSLPGMEQVILPKMDIKFVQTNERSLAYLELINNYQLNRFCDMYHIIKNPDGKRKLNEMGIGSGIFRNVTISPLAIPSLCVTLSKRELHKICINDEDAVIELVRAHMCIENEESPNNIYKITDDGITYHVSLYFAEGTSIEDLAEIYDNVTV